MDMALRRIAQGDADKGFAHVVSGFSEARDTETGCSLGWDWSVLDQILLRQGPEEVSELPITMGD